MAESSAPMFALPAGHPGDAAYRLALVRLLSARGRVTKEQVDAAAHASKRGGLFVTHLLQVGVSPEHLATALAAATGLPNAPRSDVRHPGKHASKDLDADLCHALLAVPFKAAGAELHIAYAVALPSQLTRGLPKHTAWVCLEADVRAGLMALWPRKLALLPVPGPSPSSGVAAAATPAGAPPPAAPAYFAPPAPKAVDPNDPLALVDKEPVPSAPAEASPPPSDPSPPAEEPGLTETGPGPDARELLLSSLKQYRVHAVGGLVGLLMLFGVIKLIRHSSNEVSQRAGQLGDGYRAAAEEAARSEATEQAPPALAPPRPGSDGPVAVRRATAAVEKALNTGEVATSCAALDAWRHATLEWSETLSPGPRQARLLEVTGSLWNNQLSDCPRQNFDSVKAAWAAFQERLAADS